VLALAGLLTRILAELNTANVVAIRINHKCPIVIGMINPPGYPESHYPCYLPLGKRRYAVAMTQTPVEVPDELFAGLRQYFDPRQMVELTSAIAWENYRARFDHAFGIKAEGFSAGAVRALPGGLRPLAMVAPKPTLEPIENLFAM
jgi:hypothetical protein